MPGSHQVYPRHRLLTLAIVGQKIIESRRFSGWLDPRYPIGYWWGSLELTGDASGGSAGLDLLFQQANGAARLNSQMYSVERFGMTTNDGIGRVVKITATNMAGPSDVGFSQEYAVRLEPFTGFPGSALEGEAASIVPWFLGAQRLAGISASLSMVVDNVDTIVYKLEAEGYKWSARSILADGGPQRPPRGPYRS